MKFWGIIVLVVLGGFAIFSGLRHRFSAPASAGSAAASVSSASSSSEPLPDVAPFVSPFVRCESFWARDDRVVGAFGDGLLFQGAPDGVDGSAVLYRRDRGTKI